MWAVIAAAHCLPAHAQPSKQAIEMIDYDIRQKAVKLPMKLDNNSEIIGYRRVGSDIVLTIKAMSGTTGVPDKFKALSESEKDVVRSHMRRNVTNYIVCDLPDRKELLQLGFGFVHVATDQNGVEFFRHRVVYSDCR
jgi:hypothetical protein